MERDRVSRPSVLSSSTCTLASREQPRVSESVRAGTSDAHQDISGDVELSDPTPDGSPKAVDGDACQDDRHAGEDAPPAEEEVRADDEERHDDEEHRGQ